MKANTGISEKNAKEVAAVLNKILADEFLLYTKTRNYHWNIEGPSFMEIHKLLEAQYEELDEIVDATAERIRKIGHYAQGRLKDFIQQSELVEQPYTNDQKKQLKSLLDDHETIIRYIRSHIDVFADKYKDAGSADYLTSLLQKHETTAWFLRSYLS